MDINKLHALTQIAVSIAVNSNGEFTMLPPSDFCANPVTLKENHKFVFPRKGYCKVIAIRADGKIDVGIFSGVCTFNWRDIDELSEVEKEELQMWLDNIEINMMGAN